MVKNTKDIKLYFTNLYQCFFILFPLLSHMFLWLFLCFSSCKSHSPPFSQTSLPYSKLFQTKCTFQISLSLSLSFFCLKLILLFMSSCFMSYLQYSLKKIFQRICLCLYLDYVGAWFAERVFGSLKNVQPPKKIFNHSKICSF